MNIFFSSGVSWSQRLSRSSGHGVIFASCGITPSRLWLAKMVSRSPFQPLSNKMHVADLLDRLRRRVIWRVHTARHDAVNVGRWDHATERAGDAEACIVGHDQQYVRCVLRGYYARGPIGRRLRRVAFDLALELLWRWGKLVTFDGRRRTGGAGGARNLLRISRDHRQYQQRASKGPSE